VPNRSSWDETFLGISWWEADFWLTEAEVDVYATEDSRTGFTGALQGYRVRRGSDPRSAAEMHTFSGRTVDVPAQYIAGKSEWGVSQTPGAVAKRRNSAYTHMAGFQLLDGPDTGCSRSDWN
jgi:hypothetical protein